MTWKEFVDKVNTVVDAVDVPHEQVDIRYIDILGSEGVVRVEVLKKADGRHDMFVE
jgi:hypothetical protein